LNRASTSAKRFANGSSLHYSAGSDDWQLDSFCHRFDEIERWQTI
jgi:hypothetical protein